MDNRSPNTPLRKLDRLFLLSLSAVGAFLLLMAVGCQDVIRPPIDARPFSLLLLEDLDPADDVVEVELFAAPAAVEIVADVQSQMWAYNDVLPGPLIEANVGDTVKIHFTNNLDEDTTIHWHGLRIPAAMDGVLAMQDPVRPGETFTYAFVVRDPLLAWYHPHIRADAQSERGLHGAFVIRDPDAPQIGREQIIVLDDVVLDASGAANFSPQSSDARTGRIGNTLLVNGRRRPRLDIAAGEPQLLRLANVANARTMVVRIPGQTVLHVGSDGGPLVAPVAVEKILLSAGERADILWTWNASPGDVIDLLVESSDDGGGGMGMGTSSADSTHAALQFRATDEAPAEFLPVPEQLTTLPSLEPTVTREVVFQGGMGHANSFSINGERWPDVTPIEVTQGAIERWRIENRTAFPHPFHLHGNRFVVLNNDGRADPAAWKDNVLVPPRATVDLVVSFDGGEGRWMYHCHILEHAEDGMMGEVRLSR